MLSFLGLGGGLSLLLPYSCRAANPRKRVHSFYMCIDCYTHDLVLQNRVLHYFVAATPHHSPLILSLDAGRPLGVVGVVVCFQDAWRRCQTPASINLSELGEEEWEVIRDTEDEQVSE